MKHYLDLLLYTFYFSFNSLRDGNHTMFREYTFVHITPHNRASFVRLFWKCYRQIGKKGGKCDNIYNNFWNTVLGSKVKIVNPKFPKPKKSFMSINFFILKFEQINWYTFRVKYNLILYLFQEDCRQPEATSVKYRFIIYRQC